MRRNLSTVLASVLVFLLVGRCTAEEPQHDPLLAKDANGILARIQRDGKLRVGMYLGFEGLSFRQRGQLVGLEVEIAALLAKELSKKLATTIEPEIVNQEWSQILSVLRDQKVDAVVSAVIPNRMYDKFEVTYTRSYLDSGPVICCAQRDNGPSPGITEEVESLRGKRIVIINDPAARRVLRQCGVYVESDEHSQDLERSFPRNETERVLHESNNSPDLIAVEEIIQLDEMARIYEMIASGRVDAGVIDLGIIWWVANDSARWSKQIYSFQQPIGKYIYSVVTRSEDHELSEYMDLAVAQMVTSEEYRKLCLKWHADQLFDWQLPPQSFLDAPDRDHVTGGSQSRDALPMSDSVGGEVK